MTFDFSAWMRAVWMSLIEPADMARHVLAMKFDTRVLWTAMALVAVLNVLFLALMQYISPLPVAFREDAVALSPFSLTVVIGVSLGLLVFTIYYVGQWLDGTGDLPRTLTILVWFHAINLTLEACQLVLILISPYLSALFSLVIVGAMLWCIVNFINVLHGFESLMKSFVTLILSLVGMGIIGGFVLAVLGVGPGGTA